MYRNDFNARSPMRVFEGSMHGGLGRGNLGVVASRAGVGKTAMLVQIGLDNLLRDRKVLHISHEHAVDHVRSYYDEIFHEIATHSRLEAPEAVPGGAVLQSPAARTAARISLSVGSRPYWVTSSGDGHSTHAHRTMPERSRKAMGRPSTSAAARARPGSPRPASTGLARRAGAEALVLAAGLTRP